ncbi:centrosomal protein of 170 kDa protein B-like isoform X3 [Liolophura sinensis]|uniref:centrosomal protein of 170 kDa protein B-like isoform X3 n=1 Tax=Liolophura sinensis TaxID=3198878 RepID=UPI0031585BC8
MSANPLGSVDFHLIYLYSWNSEEEPGGQPVDWCLTDRYGQRQKLPKTMIFLGREECDIILQSETVDKRHAVVTFDHYLNKFKIKDLSTANGTYVNDTKITEQTYVTLEHLDSLRLGFDTTVYHVERMDKLGGGGLPAVIPQSKPPAWASRHLTHMAECKGCIAEQQIHHTCGVHVHLDPRQQVGPAQLTCGHQHDLNGLDDPSGYHTWPRKGEKLCKMRHIHQKEGQIAADQTNSSQCSDGLQDSCHSAMDSQSIQRHSVCTASDADPLSHYPSDPKVQYPGEPKAQYPSALSKPVMYIDSDNSRSLDSDTARSGFSQDHLDNGVMQPERDTNNVRKKDNLTDLRISSDSKSEVDRALKGTPLYGQPAWWGEDEKEGQGTETGSSAPQPKSHSDVKSVESTTKPGADIDWGYDPQKYKSDPKYSQRYMEIPARDTDPDLESPVHPTMNNDSVLSKDSLSPDVSPNQDKREVSVEKSLSSQPTTKTHDTSAMAFTVDLGDEKPSKKMNMSGSLSEFVPSKIRRSFRERLEKASSKASQPVNKEELSQSEEREHSPTRQKKLEDLWGMAEEKVSKKPKTPRHSASKAGGDGRLSGEEEGSLREEKPAQNNALKKASKPSDRKSPKERQPFDSSTFTKVKSASGKVRSEGVSADVPLSDPASFLIDKMFETSTCKQSRTEQEIIPQVTEHALYKESTLHDAEYVRKSSRLPKAQQDLAYLKPQKSGQEPLVAVSKVRAQRGKENVIDAEEGDDVGEEVEKTSEAGTYTIELDEEAQAEEEEQEARQSIDHIFGISRDGLNRPVVDEGETFHRSDVNHDDSEERSMEDHLEQVEEDLDKLEWQRADGGLLSSMEVEVGSGYDSRQQQSTDKAKVSALDVPQTLIKQRTFLKENGSHSSPDGNKSSSSKDSLNSMSPSDRPPSGHQKKRPGTGRKLPSLPSGSPRSDPSPRLSDIVQRTRDFSPKGENSAVKKEKSVTISSHVVTHNGKMDSSRSGSTSDITLTNVSSLSSSDLPERTVKTSKSESARSLASIDTEILLRDTETVMAAMEARMVSRRQAEECNQDFCSICDSDTDVSSTVAVVNEVPESSVGRGRQGDKLVSHRLAQVKGQKVKPKPVQKQDSTPKLRESPVSAASLSRKLSLPCDTDRSLVSDVLSDNDSISVRSDASTDYSETSSQPSRKGSKGKGTITMTRPNRAFQLRRLRAEGSTESPDNTKSDSSSVCTSTPKSTGRPVSGRSISRPNSTGASDRSLGAAIAKKGKQNAGNSQQNFARTDGGRYSLRSTKSTTSTTSSKSSASGSSSTTKTSTPETARKKELRDLKSHLKNKHDLTVTGVSHKSRSQPPSRSNSPKTQERNAWKRRKEYDPRKAVAEAKASKARATKASSNPPPAVTKTKRPTPERGASKMNRSASYTNNEDFNKFGRESMGDSMSSDDLNSALHEEAADNFNQAGFQRPFRPRGAQSMTSVRDHCGHSGDENSSSLSEESTDLPLSYGMLSLRPYKSAFTPPPKSRSPASPPLSPPFRRANNSHDLYSARSVPGLVHRHTDLHTQSYDNLIISSIYQLSLKLKTSTDRTLEKLRDNRRVSGSPSPVFELSNQPTSGEIPAWNAANQELAAILKNLRKMDHRMQVINKALFPGEEGGTESARLTSREKKQYLQEIQRIHELAGFRPIDNPEQVWKMPGEEETEDIDDNTSNVSEIEDFVDEEYY